MSTASSTHEDRWSANAFFFIIYQRTGIGVMGWVGRTQTGSIAVGHGRNRRFLRRILMFDVTGLCVGV